MEARILEENVGVWIEKLRNSRALIVVEGKKDVAALKKLGIANAVSLKKAIFEEIEVIAKKRREVIILTDLDPSGKRLYGALNSGFQRIGVRVDSHFREFLMENTNLRQIEGLPRYLERKGIRVIQQ